LAFNERQYERELRSGGKGMSAGLLKRMSMVVGVGKSGDKSVDKRVFLCIERWMNCGYRLVFRNKFINQQVNGVT